MAKIEPITVTVDIKVSEALAKSNTEINNAKDFIDVCKNMCDVSTLPTKEIIELRGAVFQWLTELEQLIETRETTKEDMYRDDEVTATDVQIT